MTKFAIKIDAVIEAVDLDDVFMVISKYYKSLSNDNLTETIFLKGYAEIRVDCDENANRNR